jgi:hypothetical protein
MVLITKLSVHSVQQAQNEVGWKRVEELYNGAELLTIIMSIIQQMMLGMAWQHQSGSGKFKFRLLVIGKCGYGGVKGK